GRLATETKTFGLELHDKLAPRLAHSHVCHYPRCKRIGAFCQNRLTASDEFGRKLQHSRFRSRQGPIFVYGETRRCETKTRLSERREARQSCSPASRHTRSFGAERSCTRGAEAEAP